MGEFNVKAILRTDKKRLDGQCPVHVKITIAGKSMKLATSLSATQQEWITNLGIFNELGSSVRNSILKKKITAIETFLWKHIAAGNQLTLQLMKDQFKKQKDVGFHALLDECFEVQFRILAEGTKKHYLLVKRRLLEFQPKIAIGEVDIFLLARFEKFLKDRGIGISGIATHHKIVNVVINYGIRKRVIKENPYADFKVKRAKPRNGTLTSEEIKALQTLTFTTGKHRRDKGLELTRDMFLFSCYTALRFGDVAQLTRLQVIGDSHLLVEQEKTGAAVEVPLLRPSLDIIEKYSAEERDTVFPRMENQTSNRHLKKIAKMCGIAVNLHFHLSRHTFGNIMAASGMNAFTLSKLMGHTSMRTTMIYVNNPIDAVREQMAQAKIFSVH